MYSTRLLIKATAKVEASIEPTPSRNTMDLHNTLQIIVIKAIFKITEKYVPGVHNFEKHSPYCAGNQSVLVYRKKHQNAEAGQRQTKNWLVLSGFV